MTIQTNQRFWRHWLMLMILLVLLWQLLLPTSSTQAAILTVCPSGCAFSKIQDAITAANPGDTIAIGAGTYLENLIIDKDLTLQGESQASTILDGQGLASVVIVNAGKRVTIMKVTITHGLASGRDHSGGGIFNEGILVLKDSNFSGNTGTRGGGIFGALGTIEITNGTIENNSSSLGGGLYTDYSTSLVINNSLITGNSASSMGGGLYIAHSTDVLINDSLISSNQASNFGGGIFSRQQSQLTLTRSIIHDNQANIRGGGFYSEGGNTIAINNSTFSANKQVNDPVGDGGGGAIFVEPYATMTIRNSTIAGNAAGSQSSTRAEDGGGIVNFWSTVTIVNSTISDNTAPNRAGGIYSAGPLTLLNTTISDNAGSEGGGIINAGGAPSEIILRNSIIGNSVSGGDCVNLGLFTDEGYNLVEDGSCITASTSRTGDPRLEALADNGGPTLTQALLADSPAIDGVGADTCTVETDQRGVARPQPTDGLCDIGAFELERVVNNANNVIFISSTAGGRIGNIRFDDEDILAYNRDTGVWSKYFDGSRMGLVRNDINAFTLLDDGSILMSFNSPQLVPGLGRVTDADIVKFTAAEVQAGIPAAGRFEWFLDGSDVGLVSGCANIDSLSLTADGRLLISTRGPFAVAGLHGQDEDLFVLNDATFGADSAGHWALYFDGSDVGLKANSEDVKGAWLDPTTGDLYLVTEGWFAVAGLSGDANDIFLCTPAALSDNTQCTFSFFWDGAQAGFGRGRIDGLAIGNSDQLASSTLLGTSGDELIDATIDTEEDADDIDIFSDEEDGDAQTHQIFLPVMTR